MRKKLKTIICLFYGLTSEHFRPQTGKQIEYINQYVRVILTSAKFKTRNLKYNNIPSANINNTEHGVAERYVYPHKFVLFRC